MERGCESVPVSVVRSTGPRFPSPLPYRVSSPKYLLATVLAFGCILAPLQSGGADIADADAWVTALDTRSTAGLGELLGRGVDPNIAAANGKTGLMLASQQGETKLVEALIEAGADVNAVNDNGGTPLMYAAMVEDPEATELLIGAGANVDATAKLGWTALLVAAVKGHGKPARALIEAGADLNRQDAYGWTCLMRAVRGGHADIVAMLLGAEGIRIDVVQETGSSALHIAAAGGHAQIARMLARHGADIDLRDMSGRTPSAVARGAGFNDLAAALAGTSDAYASGAAAETK